MCRYQNGHTGFGRSSNDEKERDDNADCNSDFDVPDYGEDKGQQHECQVYPWSHPEIDDEGTKQIE